jgi:hypothetical protein
LKRRVIWRDEDRNASIEEPEEQHENEIFFLCF